MDVRIAAHSPVSENPGMSQATRATEIPFTTRMKSPKVRTVSGRVRMRMIGRITALDRKSTRLNSSHSQISYAVFCLKKKNINTDLKCRGNDSTPQTVKRQMPSPEREHIARLPEDVDMSVVTAQCCEHLLT